MGRASCPAPAKYVHICEKRSNLEDRQLANPETQIEDQPRYEEIPDELGLSSSTQMPVEGATTASSTVDAESSDAPQGLEQSALQEPIEPNESDAISRTKEKPPLAPKPKPSPKPNQQPRPASTTADDFMGTRWKIADFIADNEVKSHAPDAAKTRERSATGPPTKPKPSAGSWRP
jgi:hypothetical protein